MRKNCNVFITTTFHLIHRPDQNLQEVRCYIYREIISKMNKLLVLLLATLLLIGLTGTSPVPSDALSEIAEGPSDPELDNVESIREKREAGRSFSRFGAPTFAVSVGK